MNQSTELSDCRTSPEMDIDHERMLCPTPPAPHEHSVLSLDLSHVLEGSGCPRTTSVGELLEFEKLLADLLTTFINLSGDQVDSQIESALRRIVEFLEVDRGGLAEFLVEQRQMVITHSYHKPGVPPQPRTVVAHELPWYAKMIQEGNVFRACRMLDELPPTATAERGLLRPDRDEVPRDDPIEIDGLGRGCHWVCNLRQLPQLVR